MPDLLVLEATAGAARVALIGHPAGHGEPRIRRSDRGRASDGHPGDRLVLLVDALLSAAAIEGRTLTGIVGASGPGSFAGVRTALAVGAGLALAWGVPLWSVSGFDALAATADPARPALGCFDYGRDLAVCAVIAQGRSGPPLGPGRPAELMADLTPGPMRLLGPGAARFADACAGAEIDTAEPELIGYAKAASGRESGPPRPLYLRPPDATPAPGVRPIAPPMPG